MFLERHQDKFETLKSNHSQFIWQIITLEGVIFGGIMLFQDKSTVTISLFISLLCLILSIIIGVILQRLRIDSDYWSHDFRYKLRKGSNEFARKLWKDVTLDWEKEITKNINLEESTNSREFINKIFTKLHLTQERIELGFVVFFIISLIFLFIHTITLYLCIK